jgi:hypothetical protein
MTRPDLPDKWHDLFAGFALGNLTPNEQAELEQLLAAQPELQVELHAYESAFNQLPQTLPQPASLPDLESKILQQVHTAIAIPSPGKELIAARLAGRRYWWGAGAIAAGLLVFLGWDNYRLRQSLTAQQQQLVATQDRLNEAEEALQQLEREQQDTEAVLASLQNPKAVYTLAGTGPLDNTLGSIVTIAAENQAILVAHELPSLPAEEVYRFWVASGDDELMYCGQFTANATGPITWSLPDADCGRQSSQVAITIDPITASTESGGELVMLSPALEPTN